MIKIIRLLSAFIILLSINGCMESATFSVQYLNSIGYNVKTIQYSQDYINFLCSRGNKRYTYYLDVDKSMAIGLDKYIEVSYKPSELFKVPSNLDIVECTLSENAMLSIIDRETQSNINYDAVDQGITNALIFGSR